MVSVCMRRKSACDLAPCSKSHTILYAIGDNKITRYGLHSDARRAAEAGSSCQATFVLHVPLDAQGATPRRSRDAVPDTHETNSSVVCICNVQRRWYRPNSEACRACQAGRGRKTAIAEVGVAYVAHTASKRKYRMVNFVNCVDDMDGGSSWAVCGSAEVDGRICARTSDATDGGKKC